MSSWICCNSCFLSPSADRRLAVTTCGHVICSVCYQKGKPGTCLICSAKCQLSPLSDQSSSEVKALFFDINVAATKHLTEISKVVMFQARHQKRLLSYHQQKNGHLEEVLVKMKQEMQEMAKKLNEQSAHITKLENALQKKSAKVSLVAQMNHSSNTPHGHESVQQILNNPPVSLSRHSSSANISENMDVDERSMFRKPNAVPRLSLISPPQGGRIGIVPHRTSNPNMLADHSANPAKDSRPMTPDNSYSQRSGFTSPIFKSLSSFRQSMSSLNNPALNQKHT